MGVLSVFPASDKKQMQAFMQSLLLDLQALEYMLDRDMLEGNVRRIGAEQELCIVDRHGRPAMIATNVLEQFHPEWLTTELARFNLEFNLSPQLFTGDCFSDLEAETADYLNQVRRHLADFDASVLLTGIMPTIRKTDMTRDNITPVARYYALLDGLREMRGKDHELRLEGIDELSVRHDSPFLEACNTSFQVHLQIPPREFVPYYNVSLAVAAPVLAMAANSPLLFGKRLWHETRIALFQQSVDTRVSHDHLRERSPRVTFGHDWLHHSILEIYKEDISRFRPILSTSIEENSFEQLARGEAPKLRALQVHNSTVYRWNRPCYGVTNGIPHLRIENRVLPAGPTIADEVANAAFWIGLMEGMTAQYGDVRKHFDFADVQDNFIKAARYGIDTKFTWMGDRKVSVCDLVKGELLDLARKGLERQAVNPADITRYLDIIAERAERHTNGARWQLRGYTALVKTTTRDEALTALTSAMMRHQQSNTPVHLWEEPMLTDIAHYEPAKLRIEDCMSTDLHTVAEDDIPELVATMMDWAKTRYIPVENEQGLLVGLLTSRRLLRYFVSLSQPIPAERKTAGELMHRNPISIAPDARIVEALDLMDKHGINCLPVVKSGELVGIITSQNILVILQRELKKS